MRRTFVLAALLAGCGGVAAVKMVVEGESRMLRERGKGARPSAPETPPLLFLAMDGVSRDLLYEMLKHGELPNLEALLGGDKLAHAHLDETMLSTLPSSTMAAWATMMTGMTPAEHGVTGNEYFARETETFAVPAPISFSDAAPTFEIYTDDYMNKLIDGPTVYERMKALNSDSLIWVAMHQVFRGADRLLTARRSVAIDAIQAFATSTLKKLASGNHARDVFANLDEEVLSVVEGKLEDPAQALPDVLTIYLSGTDLYTHVANEGPDVARREYLKEVVDPALAKLVAVLRKRNALANRWVIVSSDHGHTEVPHDHNIDVVPPDTILAKAGFRIRPPSREVAKDTPYNAVVALGGAMAYIYVADRSQCPGERDTCPWAAAPRYEEDVLVAADAFYRANLDDPKFKGHLDMVLTRQPKPAREIDDPFEVYVGDGKTVPIGVYLKEHPHPSYIAVESRMRDLGVGIHGDHAGDVILFATDGNEPDVAKRYYFSHPYHSWHGSPSKDDSEIPFIVANASVSRAAIADFVKDTLGDRPAQQGIANVMLALRAHPPD